MKLKFRKKIRGGLLLVFFISIVIGAYGFFAINRITDYIAQMEELTHANIQANNMVMAHHIWVSRITESFMFGTDFVGGLNPTTCIWGQWRYGESILFYDDPIINSLIHSIDHPHARLHLDGAEALRLREVGRYEEAFYLLENVVLPYGEISTANITALSDRYHQLWSNVRESLRQVGGEVATTILIIYAVSFLAFLALSYWIPKSIILPMKRLVGLVSDVTHGKLAVNKTDDLPNDEIGTLTHDIYELTDVIQTLVADLSGAYKEYIEIGNMHYSIDDSKYENSFKEMIGLVNHLLAATTNDILSIASVLEHVSNGEFNENMDTDVWVGEWVVMPTALNRLTDNLKAVSTEINAMIEATAERGDLTFSIDAKKYSGNWRKIMEGLNSIEKAIAEPLRTIELAMLEMKQGNLDLKEIDKYITSQGLNASPNSYNGTFKNIVATFDDVIATIDSYVTELGDVLSKIAEGDLKTKIDRHYVGSFSLIKSSVNSISETLNNTMSEISASSTHVLAGASQIAKSASELSQGAATQANSVYELNNTVATISSQTKQTAENSLYANELSGKSAANARAGNDAMTQMVEAMAQIKESSNDISKIVKTIQDIAFQTNLLALNASVEAARAGEHGKGFAVVANEVRTLARRSQTAATETEALIRDSIQRVDTGTNIAETTAASLSAIVESADEVLSLISKISSASKEQAEAIESVGSGITQISSVTQSNSAVSQQAAAASQELNSQAEMLQHLVTYFRV
jgi:methyl-accepting chemotaxis protein